MAKQPDKTGAGSEPTTDDLKAKIASLEADKVAMTEINNVLAAKNKELQESVGPESEIVSELEATIENLKSEKAEMFEALKELSTKLENANKATKKKNVIEHKNKVYQLALSSIIMKIEGKHVRLDAEAFATDKTLVDKVLAIEKQTFLREI